MITARPGCTAGRWREKGQCGCETSPTCPPTSIIERRLCVRSYRRRPSIDHPSRPLKRAGALLLSIPNRCHVDCLRRFLGSRFPPGSDLRPRRSPCCKCLLLRPEKDPNAKGGRAYLLGRYLNDDRNRSRPVAETARRGSLASQAGATPGRARRGRLNAADVGGGAAEASGRDASR